MKEILHRHWDIPLLLAVLFFVIMVKAPHLGLPYYWDEAFPYSYLVGHMAEHGPSLLPTAAPAEYTRGHPLFFPFLQATWMQLFGNAFSITRILPLIFSLTTLTLAFLLGNRLFGKPVGITSALLLCSQNTFLAQACFVLPEMLLALLLLASLLAMYAGKYWWMAIFLTMLVFTKESGIILLAVLLCYDLTVLRPHLPWREKFKSALIYLAPLFLNFLFFLYQKQTQGWFFFPMHTGFISFEWKHLSSQLSRFFSYLFLYHGRNALFFLALASGLYFLFKNRKGISFDREGKYALLLFLVILVFLLFSAANFYSNRYLLCLFPPFTMLVSYLLWKGFGRYRVLFAAAVIGLTGSSLFASFHDLKDSDHTLGYTNAVLVQKQAVGFCLAQGWHDEPLRTAFLMSKNLTSHYPGYVDKDHVFSSVNAEDPSRCSLFIFSSNEPDNMDELIQTLQLVPVRKFEHKQAWCAIYSNPQFPVSTF